MSKKITRNGTEFKKYRKISLKILLKFLVLIKGVEFLFYINIEILIESL